MVKTVGNEYYYMVSGLTVPQYMVSKSIMQDIESYIDWVARKANTLARSMEYNSDVFVEHMEEVYALLCAIHAHWLEMEAARILRLTEMYEFEICRSLITPFVSNLHTLSVDIQMAKTRGAENGYRQRNDIERCRGFINSLKVVSSLIKCKEFEKAIDSALTIEELQESESSKAFMECLVSKKGSKALGMIKELTDYYNKKIDDIIEEATKAIMLKKIAVVDDMPEVLSTITYMLKEHYQVFSFTQGAELLEFIEKKQAPDAFILDIEMPYMDGFTLAQKIKSKTLFKDTPILFLTGNSARETIAKSARYGAKAFLIKPSNKDIIISKLSSCLQ